MSTIMTASDLLSRAIAFIMEELNAPSPKRLQDLLDDAAMRFNLSPNDAESLARILAEKIKKES